MHFCVGFSPDVMDVDAVSIAWHVPSEAEQLFADELMDLVYTPSIKVQEFTYASLVNLFAPLAARKKA